MDQTQLTERLIRIEERISMMQENQVKFAAEMQMQISQLFGKLEKDFMTKHEFSLREQISKDSMLVNAVNLSKVITIMTVAFSVIWVVLKHA